MKSYFFKGIVAAINVLMENTDKSTGASMSCKTLISCPVDSWWFISVIGVLIWNLAWIKNHLSENLLLAAFIHFLLCKCSEATIYPSEGAFLPSVAHFYNVCRTVRVCVCL